MIFCLFEASGRHLSIGQDAIYQLLVLGEMGWAFGASWNLGLGLEQPASRNQDSSAGDPHDERLSKLWQITLAHLAECLVTCADYLQSIVSRFPLSAS